MERSNGAMHPENTRSQQTLQYAGIVPITETQEGTLGELQERKL